ncbi:MAG: RNA polymerase sigma factor [Planctomycetota bacterium]
MHGERHAVDAEALLAHREFVRGLALQLVFDEHRADDVVQETWLAALQHAPARPRSLRAWLARVARNIALKATRSELRRARRERLVARQRGPRPPPPVPDAVARLASERRVVDAVLALDEPYRTTIILRFYEDLAPTEIARRPRAVSTCCARGSTARRAAGARGASRCSPCWFRRPRRRPPSPHPGGSSP